MARGLRIATYNLHGFNMGLGCLSDLCDRNDIVAVQEHWLPKNKLHQLSTVNSNFAAYGISSMNEATEEKIIRGRPFGGVGFLWRKDLANRIKILHSGVAGRCLAMSIDADDGRQLVLINVYFPCSENSSAYFNELGHCIGFIEGVLANCSQNVIVLGDFNFACAVSAPGFARIYDALKDYSVYNCDHLMSCDSPCYSYVHETLGHKSLLDHFFMSEELIHAVQKLSILEESSNLSDHLPVECELQVLCSTRCPIKRQRNCKIAAVRWDKSNVSDYYCASRSELSKVAVPVHCFSCSDEVCTCNDHHEALNRYYEDIVNALETAANRTIVKLPCSALKVFWTNELDSLKQDSIFWHNIWKDAGRPGSGIIHNIKCRCKLKYKQAIKDAYLQFEYANSDDLAKHFANKRMPDFWKCWNKKFSKNVTKQVTINGCSDDVVVANAFADFFGDVYYDSSSNMDALNAYKEEFDRVKSIEGYNIDKCLSVINVESVDKSIRNLKCGKACGPDNISAEHLQYAHPSLVMHLKLLFHLMVVHSCVPHGFGKGYVIPLVKDKSGNLNSVENYRAITLGPVIAKVFESIVMVMCEQELETDDLQFGFKKGLGCTDAIFLCRSTIDHFTQRGSNVYAASLDISKAFDKVNHFKLFHSLINAGMPLCMILLLANWYDKLFVTVRWNGSFSYWFAVRSGVRQGSVLSPALFAVFMNLFIVRVRLADLGCYINRSLVSCVLYADDIIFLSASLAVLQQMLDIATVTAETLLLEFNTKKSVCIAFGPRIPSQLPSLLLGHKHLEWRDSISYLGVTFLSGKHIKTDCNMLKRKFYAACNCVFSNCYNVSEVVQLQLQESYCLPILTYAAPALNLCDRQLRELNVCWNGVYRKIFKFHQWESVKGFIYGMGRCDIIHILALRKLQYLCRLQQSQNVTLCNILQCFKLSDEYMKLLTIYRCGSRDSIHNVKRYVERHFATLAVSRL